MEQLDNFCTYCGVNNSLVREHVIPASYFGMRKYDSTQQWIVMSCERCNTLAGACVYFSIPEKATYLIKRYKTRYKRALNTPLWDSEELRELDYRLRSNIEEAMLAKVLLRRKIQYLESVATYPRDYLRPKWAERVYLEWEAREKIRNAWENEQRKFRKRKRKKHHV